MTNSDKVMTGILIVFIFFVITSWVRAGDRYHYVSNSVVEKASNAALPAAAGQHHYKATASLQWSVSAAFSENDSAVSFGLGLQTGDIFASGSFTTDGDAHVVGIAGSGTF